MLFNQIKAYLEEMDKYYPHDKVLIDILIDEIKQYKNAEEEIKKGVYENITRNKNKEPYYRKKGSVEMKDKAIRNIMNLFSKLSLSPSDRLKLKLKSKEKADLLDSILN